MPELIEALGHGRVLLMDGAMGTELLRAGAGGDPSLAAWNLLRPEKITAIHRSYVEAGAEILLTNTFQANGAALPRHHLEQELTAIIKAGVKLARTALTGPGWVLADIGPLVTTDKESVGPILGACSEADALLLETFSDPAEAAVFIRANKAEGGPNKPTLLSFTFDGDTLRTFRGASAADCAGAAQEMGAAAVGVNCGKDVDTARCAELLTRYRAATDLPLFTRLNAGSPKNGTGYPHSPELMARGLEEILSTKIAMVGGCCGTTPEHIRAFRAVVDAWNRRQVSAETS